MNCTPEQKAIIIDTACQAIDAGVKYDFGSTWACIWRKFIPLDVQKLNCSEWAWFLLRSCERVEPRYAKSEIEIAPVPGDMPVWCGATKIYQLDMTC